MRVFVTGATGFIGSALVPELIGAGHQVLGLTRSEAGADSLARAGAQVHRGDLEDLESLRSGAAQSDAVIHLAFNHDFSKFLENCATDRRVIEALGTVLAGSDRLLIVTSGTGMANPASGVPATEDVTNVGANVNPRAASEQTVAAAAAQGSRVIIVRLPQVHDTVKQGLVSYAIRLAREKGVVAYVGDGKNRTRLKCPCPAGTKTQSRIAQVEQQLTSNNGNAGGSFIEAGLQQINVREVGLVRDLQDIENTVITTRAGTPLRVKDIAVVTQGPEIRLGQFGRAIRREDGKIIDNDDVVSGIAVLQKGDDAQPTLDGIHKKVQQLNDQILPKGVKIVPFIDRSDLLRFTTDTVLRNLSEGIVLVVIILFLFLGNVRGALIVALTIPFSLLFASICLDLKQIPANLLSLGALDFGMVVDGAVVMVENIVRHLSHNGTDSRTPREKISEAAHEVQRPVFYAILIIITAYLPIFTLQAVEGRLFRPMAWTVAFALLGALLFSMIIAPVLSSLLFRKGAKEWKNPVMGLLTARYRKSVTWAI
jgi:NAD(P)-dependent dehydrogenase (short-subunit alcohol dehydrogenase family)